MTDFAAARRMMVDGQVRTADVTDLRVIAAMLEVPRERFVPTEYAGLAYLDIDLPVEPAGGRRLLKPMVLGKMIQAAELAPTDRVLDVGCATGYSAAVLARVAGEVVALEQDADLLRFAADALRAIPNAKVVSGPLNEGWPGGGPYDAILLDGATEIAPEALLRQLNECGRLLCVQGSSPGAKATLYRKSQGDIGVRPIFDARATTLPGFGKAPAFAF